MYASIYLTTNLFSFFLYNFLFYFSTILHVQSKQWNNGLSHYNIQIQILYPKPGHSEIPLDYNPVETTSEPVIGITGPVR